VVVARSGVNPRELIDRVKAKITDLQAGLPAGVQIVPFYRSI
jgi:Cu/Ag efflux pump CusA